MKILDYKMNAVMAKARAMYGQRLTGEDYDNLVACSSVTELVTYLKTRTSYADALKNVSASQSEAGYIEFIIRKRAYTQFNNLCHYEMTLGEEFSNYFIVNEEVKQILSCIKSVLLGNSEKYIMNMPSFYERSLHFNVKDLMGVRSLRQLSQVLDGTPYKKIIDTGVKNNSDYIDYECALTNYFNEYEYNLIKKNCTGKGKQQMMSLLAQKADLQFIDKIYRIKKYFISNQTLMSVITPAHLTSFSERQIKAFLNAENEKEVLELLSETNYRQYAQAIKNSLYIEQAINQTHYTKNKRMLRFSTDPNVVMFCFMFLIENEVDNLIHIIEGIKYETNREKIRALLIGVGD